MIIIKGIVASKLLFKRGFSSSKWPTATILSLSIWASCAGLPIGLLRSPCVVEILVGPHRILISAGESSASLGSSWPWVNLAATWLLLLVVNFWCILRGVDSCVRSWRRSKLSWAATCLDLSKGAIVHLFSFFDQLQNFILSTRDACRGRESLTTRCLG